MDIKIKKMTDQIKAENINFSNLDEYKRNKKLFTSDFIREYRNKIQFGFLFKAIKIKDIELRKELFYYFMENIINSEKSLYDVDNFNFVSNLKSFFDNCKLEIKELEEYVSYLFKNKKYFDFWLLNYISESISMFQDLNEEYINYLIDNNLIESRNYKNINKLFLISDFEFVKKQNMPVDFYYRNTFFNNEFSHIQKLHGKTLFLYTLRYQKYSNNILIDIVNNTKYKDVVYEIMYNKNNNFTKEEQEIIAKKYLMLNKVSKNFIDSL